MVDKIKVNDPRIQYKTIELNGRTYNYLLSNPSSPPLNTIFLIHGFPDLSLGWRYQIPMLTSLGLRVIALDMMGYGGSSAPASPSHYTFARAANDIASLAASLNLSSIILGGHDWGGSIVYRVAMRYPQLISAVFSVCTPFRPPQANYVPATVLPNFKYQIQFMGTELEEKLSGEQGVKLFLNGMYGGKGPNGEVAWTAAKGVDVDILPRLAQTVLLNREELDFYAQQYARNGLHGPLNWYRTGELNFADEQEYAAKFEKEDFRFEMPVLFIAGSKDTALPPALSRNMERWFRSLTRDEVDAGHWALWERPEEVNGIIRSWLLGLDGVKANM